MRDSSPHVRAAAIRIAEASLPRYRASVADRIDDPSPLVRRQATATLGALPPAEREPELTRIALRHGDDPIVADLIVSALPGAELAFLERLLPAYDDGASEPSGGVVRALVATLARQRDPAALSRLLTLAGSARPRWQQAAMLEGLSRARGAPVALTAAPRGVMALASASGDSALSRLATAAIGTVTWPGKPVPPPPSARPLTPGEQARFADGARVYAGQCAGCHQENGEGLAGVAKPLAGSKWAVSNPRQVIRIVLHGKEGEMLMPPLGGSLSDEQLAAVLTYVRRSWGNQAGPIAPDEVAEVRGEAGGGHEPWTEEELGELRR